jgi:hypothetical protein
MLIFGLVNLSQAQVHRFQSPPLKFMHSVDKEFGADLDREMGLFKIVPSGSRFQNLCNDWIYLVNDRKLIYSSKLLTLNENPIFNKNYKIKLDQLSKVDSYHITKSNGRISVIYKVKS